MKAIVQDRYGHARDVMRLDDLDRPMPIADQMRVKVYAAGLDRGARHLMMGEPRVLRLGFGLRKPRTPVRGREFAGVVDGVGPDSTAQVGDRVFGIADGAFAEYLCASPKKVLDLPEGVSLVRAAALPISGITALQAVRDHAEIAAGHNVLIIGASGGVGAYAVRIAAHLGARVTAVCSGAKSSFVESLGATEVLDYSKSWTGVSGFDAILDIGGGTPLPVLRRMLTPTGVLVIVGAETGGRWFGGIQRQIRASLLSPFVKQKLVMQLAREDRVDIEELGRLAAEGVFDAVAIRTYPLHATAEAMEDLGAGSICGKAVIEIGDF